MTLLRADGEPVDRDKSAVAIRLDNVSKAYKMYDRPFSFLKEAITGRPYHRDKEVLRNISLSIHRGEVVGIIGRNGAGKSTLLKIIAGTLASTHGEVSVNGRVSAILELGTGFNPNYSGRDNVIMSALMRGMPEAAIRRKFDGIVTFAGLEDVIDEPFHTYSSGMQARLAFAAAISVEADILVIDEALAAGDARFASRSLRRMHEICESGVTALFVSHVSYHVMQLCTRVVWIDGGRVRMDGDPISVVRAYDYDMEEAIARDQGRLLTQPTPEAVPQPAAPIVADGIADQAQPDAVATEPASADSASGDAAPMTETALPGAGCDSPGSALDVMMVTAPATQIEVVQPPDDGAAGGDTGAQAAAEATAAAVVQSAVGPEQGAPADAQPDRVAANTPAATSEAPVPSASDSVVAPTSAATPDDESRTVHRFSTGQYRILDIAFLDENGTPAQAFRLGGTMRLRVSYECLLPEIPDYSCGLAVALNRVSDFEAVMYFNTNYPHSDEEIRSYFSVPFRQFRGRRGLVEAAIDPIQVRAGEYYVSLGILPNQPGMHEFYEYIRCYCRIRILASGFDEPSVFYPIVSWSNGPLDTGA